MLLFLLQLYDGLGKWDTKENNSWSGEYDDYDQWFESVMPGKDPQVRVCNMPLGVRLEPILSCLFHLHLSIFYRA